jgi:hypothetical protein
MGLTKEEAVEKARADLAQRLGVKASEVAEEAVVTADFPNMALGAPLKGEMSAQMIASGWRITLNAAGQKAEYRTDLRQLRLFKFKGANFRIV